jgi:cobyric acid synthase
LELDKMKKIGFLYVKGAVPGFEDFGNLPTHLLKDNGLVNGLPAHNELDGLIIPGGSIVESQSLTPDLEREIRLLDREGKFIFGMCSGFQVLSNKTDIGRKSPCPVEKEGLGLLDVTFHPMIGTDRVEAEITGKSFLTEGLIGENITGFHCHTYGEIRGDAPSIIESTVKRTNYRDNPRRIVSGVRNDDGNVVGTMVHGALDENPGLVKNVLKFIDASEKDVEEIHDANKILLTEIRNEIGVNTGIHADYRTNHSQSARAVMIASTSSDSGKTFLTTGFAGVLRKRGYRVCVLKVGPDTRDIVPALYLNKEKMQHYSSIKIGGLGWKDLNDILQDVKSKKYDFILIEGVMSIFTGILNEKTPFSGAEIAKAADIPVVLVSGCNKGGIETAAVDLVGHTEIMGKLSLKTRGVILNKVYDEGIADAATSFIKLRTGLDFVETVPKVKLAERGNTPEVELKLEDFCLSAMRTVEENLDVDRIIQMAEEVEFKGYDSFEDILKVFR